MLAAKTLIVSTLLAMALPAMAGTTLLNFEGVSATTTALTVSNPYKDLGINFTANAVSAASKKARVNPGNAFFYNGLDGGFTDNRGALVLWDGKDDTGTRSFFINVAQGFDTSFGLSYTSGASGTVQIFSGENGTGDLISELGLVKSKTCAADPRYLCEWSDANIDLKSQVGRSIRFTGQNTQLVFDDFELQLHDVTNPTPEPGGLALSLAALGALAWGRKRKAS